MSTFPYNPDPGEGYRLLEPHEIPVKGDWHTYENAGLSGYGWINTWLDKFDRPLSELRDKFNDCISFRREIEVVAPESTFKISDVGEGRYESRDGQKFSVVKNTAPYWPVCPWSDSAQTKCWWDDGHFDENGAESPLDLVRYIGPIPLEPTDEYRAVLERKYVKGDQVEWRRV